MDKCVDWGSKQGTSACEKYSTLETKLMMRIKSHQRSGQDENIQFKQHWRYNILNRLLTYMCPQ